MNAIRITIADAAAVDEDDDVYSGDGDDDNDDVVNDDINQNPLIHALVINSNNKHLNAIFTICKKSSNKSDISLATGLPPAC